MRIILLFSSFLLLSGQINLKKGDPIFKKIPKSNFISGTPEYNPSLLIYKCTACKLKIKYVEKLTPGAYSAYFIINSHIYHIKELLVSDRMDFEDVFYINKRYLLISSPDGSASGKAYEVLKNYYLFSLNRQNKVVKFNSVIDSRYGYKYLFLKLVK